MLIFSRKKIVVFSTKSNPTTRENISNVFGAKTLHALVPLDLKFDMESSNGPFQKSSGEAADRCRYALLKSLSLKLTHFS